MNPTQTMLFTSYTPRADAATRGYDDWLRTVDGPFLNAQPGIAHHASWKITDRIAGEIPFDALQHDVHRRRRATTTCSTATGKSGASPTSWVDLWATEPTAGHAPGTTRWWRPRHGGPGEGGRRTRRCLSCPTRRGQTRASGATTTGCERSTTRSSTASRGSPATRTSGCSGELGEIDFTDFDLIYLDEDRSFEDIYVTTRRPPSSHRAGSRSGARTRTTPTSRAASTSVAVPRRSSRPRTLTSPSPRTARSRSGSARAVRCLSRTTPRPVLRMAASARRRAGMRCGCPLARGAARCTSPVRLPRASSRGSRTAPTIARSSSLRGLMELLAIVRSLTSQE